MGQDILISGRIDMNRAMEGDVVAVELLPEAQWRGPSTQLPAGAAAADGEAAAADEADEVAEAEAGAHIAQVCGCTQRGAKLLQFSS